MPFDQENFPLPAVETDEVLRVLTEARWWLNDPEHWCKHSADRDGRTCALGAVQKFNSGMWGDPKKYLEEQVPSMPHACVINFNDWDATNHADVLALFDRAIAARRAAVASSPA
jgi:hypothetical protein